MSINDLNRKLTAKNSTGKEMLMEFNVDAVNGVLRRMIKDWLQRGLAFYGSKFELLAVVFGFFSVGYGLKNWKKKKKKKKDFP